ncbi:MAG UNVERIFIED_CONTAM: hypothetical protein LVR29_22015 [Microcystis novacekii LVE1205-3]|jgi:hypothetical protein
MWLESDSSVNSFAQDTLRAYGLGISRVDVREKPFEEVVGGEADKMLNALRDKFSDHDDAFLVMPSSSGDELVFVKKNDTFVSQTRKIYPIRQCG